VKEKLKNSERQMTKKEDEMNVLIALQNLFKWRGPTEDEQQFLATIVKGTVNYILLSTI
jgi:hypothetical protein